MKIKKGFVVKTVGETNAIIWKTLENGADLNGVVAKILQEYDVSEELATKDASLVIEKLKEIGAIDD